MVNTPQEDDPNVIERFIEREKNNAIEIGKRAVQGIAGFKVGEKEVGKKALEEVATFGEIYAKPYREKVAPPLTAAMLASNPNYREQTGNMPWMDTFERAKEDSKRSAGAFYGLSPDEDTWRRSISPGRALVGLVGSITPGTQGSDKVDWTDINSVESFYTQGAAQFWSGFADANFTVFLDPWYRGFKAAQGVTKAALTRPVGKNTTIYSRLGFTPRIEKFNKQIDDAVVGVNNGIRPLIDAVENSKDIQDFISYGFVADSANPVAAAYAMRSAYEYGGREAVGDVIKVMVGDEGTFRKLIQRNDEISTSIERLQKRKEAIEQSIKEIDKQTNINYGSRLNLSAKKLREIENSETRFLQQKRALEEEKKQLGKDLKAIRQERKNLDFRVGAVEGSAEKELTSTGTDTLFHSANTTWSNFSRLEQIRVSTAKVNAKGYWGEIDAVTDFQRAKEVAKMYGLPYPRAIRMMYWLSPNQQLREVPAGSAIIDGIPAKFSYKEMNTRLLAAVKYGTMTSKEAREEAQKYASFVTPSERFAWADALEEKIQSGIIQKQLKEDFDKLTKEQKDAFMEIVKFTIREGEQQRAKIYRDLIDKNYTMVDSRSGALVAQLEVEKTVDRLAKIIAQKEGSARVTENHRTAAKETLSNAPAFSTQLPNIHFTINAQEFSNIVKENKLTFKAVLQEIEQSNLSADKIRQRLNQSKNFRESQQSTTTTVADIVFSRTRKGFDRTVDLMDLYQTFVWKPATLLSLKYTTRNIFEGWLRTYASFLDMNSKFGYGYTDMARGLFGALPYAPYRTAKNIGTRISARSSSKKLNEAAADLEIANKQIARELASVMKVGGSKFAESAIKKRAKELSEELLEANDTIAFPLVVINGKIDKMAYHIGNVKDQKVTKEILRIQKGLQSYSQGTDANSRLATALLTGDYQNAYKLSLNMNAEEISVVLDNVLEKMNELGLFLSKELEYSNRSVMKKLSPGLTDDIEDLLFYIGRLDAHMDVAKLIFRNKDQITGKFVAAQTKATAKTRLLKSYEGKVKIAKGVYIGQSLAGDADELLRSATSARTSTQRLLNQENRKTGIAITHVGKERRPIQVDEQLWASAHSEYVNNVILKDAMGKLLVKELAAGKTEEQARKIAIKWLKSGSPQARKYKRDQKVNLETNYAPNGLGLDAIVETNLLQIKQYLPKFDDLGADIRPDGKTLLQIADEGKISAEVSAKIPVTAREVVEGDIERTGPQAGLMRNIVNTIFHYTSTVPEDHAIRHPFFTMVHDSEARRITRSIRTQARARGMSKEEANKVIARNADKIKNVAVTRAYKELMQRLYSIERYTDVGSLMRFVSPFYMAHENSSRFWLGTSIRNPQIAVLMAKIYNAPYRAGWVEDEEGNVVSFGHPWSTRRDAMVLGLGDSGIGGYIKRTTGKDEIIFQPTAIDVITQGQAPIIPGIGGAFGQTALTYGLLKVNPDEITQKLFGRQAEDIVGKYIMPYYEKTYGKNLSEVFITNLNPMNSWMISAMAAIGKNDPTLATDEANNRFNARFYAAWDQIVLDDVLSGRGMNDDDQRNRAAQLAVNSLWIEALSSFLGPVVAGKLGDSKTRDIEQRYNRLVKENDGNTDIAAVQLAKWAEENYNTDMSGAVSKVITTRTSDNRLGLLATPQTLKNIQQNQSLIADIDYLFPDNSFLGELLSAGDPTEDYSQYVEDKMFSIKLNDKPLRERLNDPGERAKRQQSSMAWELYFSNIEYLESEAKSMGIEKNTKAYREKIDPLKKALRTELGKRFPLWEVREDKFQLDKVTNNLAIAENLLSNKKFMSTVGKDSPAIQGLKLYLDNREVLVELLKTEAARTGVKGADTEQNRWILDLNNLVVKEIVRQYPEFERISNRYLNDDMLEEIPTFAELDEVQ